MSEANKELARKLITEVERLKTVPEELLAPGFSYQLNGDPALGTADFKPMVEALFSAFPDLKHTIDAMIAEGDTVAMRGTIEATHQAPFMDLAPTGNRIKVHWSATTRIVDGKIADEHLVMDQMAMMQQLGALPEAATAAH